MAAQLYSLCQRQEQEQASLALTTRQQRLWQRKLEKCAEQLFNQHVLDQARIQELTAVHANKRNTLPGDRNQLSQARVLHQSDLPRLLAEREEQAKKDALKEARKSKAKGKQRATSSQSVPPSPPMLISTQASALEEEVMLPTRAPPPRHWMQPLPAFPVYDPMLMMPPPPPPFASSSSLTLDPPMPTWQQRGPYLPRMPDFL